MRRTTTVLAIAVALLLSTVGCTTSTTEATVPNVTSATPAPVQTESPTTTEPEPEERTEVDWSQYPENYQRIIDEDTASGNCEGLQATFDAAPADVDLLTYLDEALTKADCY